MDDLTNAVAKLPCLRNRKHGMFPKSQHQLMMEMVAQRLQQPQASWGILVHFLALNP